MELEIFFKGLTSRTKIILYYETRSHIYIYIYTLNSKHVRCACSKTFSLKKKKKTNNLHLL